MAVHAVQSRALNMGGVVKVQKIAAVNSWLQRSLPCCVAKARARLFLERLKVVTPTNAPARHRGTPADVPRPWGISLGGRRTGTLRMITCLSPGGEGLAPGLASQLFQPVVDICHSTM